MTDARIALGTAFLGLAVGAGADEIKGTFLNYPKSAKVTGALVKGPVSMQKTGGVWRVIDQGFSFAE